MSDYISRPDRSLSPTDEHHTVGQYFKAWDGNIYLCESHDQQGYWMHNPLNHEWRGVSERAIGRTFHQISKYSDGKWRSEYGLINFPWKMEEA